MRPDVIEWVNKAEADFVSAGREYRARKMPNYDAACFLAQQCAEKYMKGYLQYLKTPFPKTHDLVRLLADTPDDPELHSLRAGMSLLSSYAVEFRYPGEQATREIAKEALAICTSVRAALRRLLSLD